MQNSDTDRIWNRATMHSGGSAPLPGDVALASLLQLHGVIMNGGVHHGINVLEEPELHAAIKGFAFFGFDDVVEFLTRACAAAATEEAEVALDSEYYSLVEDQRLFDRFVSVFTERPEQFSEAH